MIAFSCPHCGAQLRVKDSLAGTTGPCPGCSRAVQAPAATSSAASSTAGTNSALRTKIQPNGADETASSQPRWVPPPEYSYLAPPQGPDELGRLGSYVILKVLGTGAMGVVFQARDIHLERLVALKVMKPSLAASAEFHRRFLREARLAAAIEHEHIVPIYQVGEDRGVPFLAMRLLQGETLEDRLSRTKGGLPVAELLRMGREIAEGLAAAHAEGLVHRDIKPANIWLDANRDRVKIVDFGLACGTGVDAHFTQPGAVIGTPAYMAPEQARAEEVDARSDLFSLGAVLYRAATGERPFPGESTLAVLEALANRMPEPPHKLVPALPPAFSDLVMRLLAKQPGGRPQSARAVLAALEAISLEDRGSRIEGGTGGGGADTPVGADRRDAGATSRAASNDRDPRSSAAPAVEVVEESEAPETDGEKKKPKKARRSPRRKKRPRVEERDWGRVVLMASLVLLAVAVLVLVLGIIRHVRKDRAAAPNDSTPLIQHSGMKS